jgi:hypothetical protein
MTLEDCLTYEGRGDPERLSESARLINEALILIAIVIWETKEWDQEQ